MVSDRFLIIMRGLPSSGKSTEARRILEAFRLDEPLDAAAHILSTDDFWYTQVEPDKPTEYSFDRTRLAEAHQWNQQRAMNAIAVGRTPLIIDNTNVCTEEFVVPYCVPALHAGYSMTMSSSSWPFWTNTRYLLLSKVTYATRLKELAEEFAARSWASGKNVPVEAILRMMDRWEDPLLSDVLGMCKQRM
jgi:NEDD4-binding protein 2